MKKLLAVLIASTLVGSAFADISIDTDSMAKSVKTTTSNAVNKVKSTSKTGMQHVKDGSRKGYRWSKHHVKKTTTAVSNTVD